MFDILFALCLQQQRMQAAHHHLHGSGLPNPKHLCGSPPTPIIPSHSSHPTPPHPTPSHPTPSQAPPGPIPIPRKDHWPRKDELTSGATVGQWAHRPITIGSATYKQRRHPRRKQRSMGGQHRRCSAPSRSTPPSSQLLANMHPKTHPSCSPPNHAMDPFQNTSQKSQQNGRFALCTMRIEGQSM